METVLGTLIIIGLFLLRFILPFALTLAFGYSMNRYLNRVEPHAS